jgi:predicted O-methyltransferase YrrM
MSQPLWTAVDRYLCDFVVPSDPALEAALADSATAGLPAISVTPNQGKLLHLFARLVSAKNILEIGTLGGYSTIWLARALPPGGRLVTLESDEKCAAVARANIARAGLARVVELRLGKALDTLPQIAAENRRSFDLVFIDADKENTPGYFEWAMKLTGPGSLIIVDNVVRAGAVLNSSSADASALGIRRFHEMLAAEKRVTATAIQTVGSKGHDGFAVALVTDPP